MIRSMAIHMPQGYPSLRFVTEPRPKTKRCTSTIAAGTSSIIRTITGTVKSLPPTGACSCVAMAVPSRSSVLFCVAVFLRVVVGERRQTGQDHRRRDHPLVEEVLNALGFRRVHVVGHVAVR